MMSPIVAADWGHPQHLEPHDAGERRLRLTISPISTLGADLAELGADIEAAVGALAGAYLQAFQIGDPANGDLCVECSNAVSRRRRPRPGSARSSARTPR